MIAVVIPAYRVKEHLLPLLGLIGKEVEKIYVVDDACPHQSGRFVVEHCRDPRVEVLFHDINKGVGGAMITGYKAALRDHASIVVKLDGDGQMNPLLIPYLIQPLQAGKADYVKGNRFYSLSFLQEMPVHRRIGNSMISFLSKLVSGYWNIMDPSNGFTAITGRVLRLLPLEKIDHRFFFENDMLFRLNTLRAFVYDFPMEAKYADEKSNLQIYKIACSFPVKYVVRFFKRIFYNYFLRDFNIGSMELFMGSVLMLFGLIFGSVKWAESISSLQPASAGTVILAALPVILGFQLLLAFLQFDLGNIPRKPISTDFIVPDIHP